MPIKLLEYYSLAIIFLLPSYLVRFSLFGLPTNVLEALIIVFCGATLFVKRKEIKGSIKDKWSPLCWGLALLFLGFLFGVAISPDPYHSLGVIKGWLLAPFAFVFALTFVLDTEAKKEQALTSLAYSGLGVAVIALGFLLTTSLTFDGRLEAFYDSPNLLAMYLAPSLLLWLYRVYKKSKRGKDITAFTAIYIIAFVMAITYSLGAWLGVIGALVTYVFYTKKEMWKKLWISWVISVLLFSILGPLASIFFNPWQMERTSLTSRFMMWQVSLRLLQDHWLWGIGPGTFQEAYLAQQKNSPPYLEWAAPHPHNIFLTTWLYGGVLGLAGFLLLLVSFFNTKKEGWLSSLPFLLMTYILIHGAIDNTLWRNDAVMILGLLYLFKKGERSDMNQGRKNLGIQGSLDIYPFLLLLNKDRRRNRRDKY